MEGKPSDFIVIYGFLTVGRSTEKFLPSKRNARLFAPGVLDSKKSLLLVALSLEPLQLLFQLSCPLALPLDLHLQFLLKSGVLLGACGLLDYDDLWRVLFLGLVGHAAYGDSQHRPGGRRS